MEDGKRDSTQDWLMPEHARPPTLAQLEGRIDEARAVARSSEAAVMAVGAAALDAAEQARRAAMLAERAITRAAAQTAPPPPEPISSAAAPQPTTAASNGDRLREFTARADRLAARLHRLQSLPLATSR